MGPELMLIDDKKMSDDRVMLRFVVEMKKRYAEKMEGED
jgi:hypothetical protein